MCYIFMRMWVTDDIVISSSQGVCGRFYDSCHLNNNFSLCLTWILNSNRPQRFLEQRDIAFAYVNRRHAIEMSLCLEAWISINYVLL